jgi:MtaA/CmuA family methyltransferase
MNSKQRYLALLAGQPTDFAPRLPVLMKFAAEYIGSDYGRFAADHRTLVEANLRCASDFGIDQLNTMSDPYRETEGFGAEVVYSASFGARITRPPLADGVDLAQLVQPDPATSVRMRDRVQAVDQYVRQAGDDYSVMGWVEGPAAEAADLRGVEDFFVDLLLDPEPIDELMDHCVEVAVEFARAQLAVGADTIGIGDAVASQVSAELYETHILPREQRLVAALKAAGALVRMHICGNITHILPGLATLDLDVIDIDHMVDLGVARRVLGPRVVLGANLDPVADIMQGTPDGIRAKLRAARQQAGPRFVVNAGCESPSPTPPANLAALCQPLAWDD